MKPIPNIVAWVGMIVGAAGLAIDAGMIFPSMMSGSAARSFPDVFIYFWTFFTHLTNLWLIVTYLSVSSGLRWLGWLRQPSTMASAAAFITLVMLFYHFMLAPYLQMEGALLVASYLLHYVAPLIYLAWWAIWAPHGTLRLTQIPLMLLPGVAYIAWVLLRGAVVDEYPYDILDVSKSGYGGVAIGVVALLVAVSILAALVVGADRLIARRPRSRGGT